MANLFYLLIFLFGLGQLQRVTLFDGSVNFYLHEIVMAFFVILSFSKKNVINDRLFFPTAIFISALFVSLIHNNWNFTVVQNFVGFLYILRVCLYFLFFFSLKSLSKHIIEKGLEFYTWLVIALSALQYILFPKLIVFAGLGWDPHEYRMVGAFFDVSPAGITYIFLLFFVTHQALKEPGKPKHIRFIQACVLAGFILLTFSRIAYIAFAAVLIFLLFFKAPLEKIIITLFIFLSLIMTLPRLPQGESTRLERTFSINSRIEDIQKGVQLWQKSPILGVGYNRIQYVKERQKTSSPDHASSGFSSAFVTILAGAGIIGLAGFLYFILELYKRLSFWGKLFLIPLLAASFLDNVFLHALVLPSFLLLISFVRD